MLKIANLYKEKNNSLIKDLNLEVSKGSSVSIECSNDISNLLVDLILGRDLQAKGEIIIDNKSFNQYIKENITNIGVVFLNESYYEHWTIDYYIKFFSRVLHSKVDYKQILLKFALLDISHMKIKKLNYSQRRRLSFARECLKEPKFMIIQEPILNVDRETSKIIIENINELCNQGTAMLFTSVFFKDAIMSGEKVYRLDVDGLKEINSNDSTSSGSNELNTNYKIEKLPAKVEDKIILFDPNEIDYVESVDGLCNLYVRGEYFISNFSLTELEERLKYFGFFRCHRSYIVNLQRVREVVTWTRNSYSLILSDKVKSNIPLSKGRLEELKAILKI